MVLRFDAITLFPEIFDGFLGESILKSAQERGLVVVNRWNLRDWTYDKWHKVDDRPYGGGPGMVIMPAPVFDAVEAVRQADPTPAELVMLTPRGTRWSDPLARQMVGTGDKRFILLCGRYEGFDERVYEGLAPTEISIGDFVCNGGEVPAMVLIETMMRFVPGVLGDEQSAAEDSFSKPGWVEYPQYTRPPTYRGMSVPEVLLSGNHQRIAQWRAEAAETLSQRTARDDHSTSPGEQNIC